MRPLLHSALTYEIIGAYYDVRNAMPWGMHESVYASAMCIALTHRGVHFEREVPMVVHFKGEQVGHFRADLIVDGKVIVEMKSVDRLTGVFEAQLINYLATSGLSVGLLLNFGLHGERRRIVWTPNAQHMDANYLPGRPSEGPRPDALCGQAPLNSTTDKNGWVTDGPRIQP